MTSASIQIPAHDGLPGLQVNCLDGWATITTPVMPPALYGIDVAQRPWVLLRSQAPYMNLKFATVPGDSPERPIYQLRAEIPVGSAGDTDQISEDDSAWIDSIVTQMRRVLDGLLADTAAASTIDPTSESREFGEMLDGLADLGYTVEKAAGSTLCVDVPSARQTRRISLSCGGACWRAELPMGTGDVLTVRQPMREAVGQFLLRAAAVVRFARPYGRVLDECQSTHDSKLMFGFEAHLPLKPTSATLGHALAALVTAVQRFEGEIENLATEAILSHAYLAINGASNTPLTKLPESKPPTS